MKAVFINRVDYGSSGNIAYNLYKNFKLKGNEAFFICAEKKKSDSIKINFFPRINKLLTRLFGLDGFLNFFNTFCIIRKIKKIKPDFVNIHSIVGYFLNLPILLKYFCKKNIKVFVTCHDCWYFTGKCPHFEDVKCFKWKTKCFKCPQRKKYPGSYFIDSTAYTYKQKRKCLINKNITFITPSYWLEKLLRESYLQNEKIITIHNGIKFSHNPSLNLLERESSKCKLLFIAYPWYENKGISDIDFLVNALDEKIYEFHIIGTKKLNISEKNNVFYHGFVDHNKLLSMFSLFDIFVNPSKEENLPTVDIEAAYSGLYVVAYDAGGTSEILSSYGTIVPNGNKEKLLEAILKIDFKKKNDEKFDFFEFSLENMLDRYYSIFKLK